MKQEHLSPRYTTAINEIIEASNDKDSAKVMKRFMKKLLKILKR